MYLDPDFNLPIQDLLYMIGMDLSKRQDAGGRQQSPIRCTGAGYKESGQ
jgi:hypothetical protein